MTRPAIRQADERASRSDLSKPAFGAPCNGCGFCCKAIPCRVARDLIGAREGPCPALEFEDGRDWALLPHHSP